MRRFPFSFSNSFLAKLGYRRKKSRRRPQRIRRSLFEALEERAMLDGTPLEESLNESAILVTASTLGGGPVFYSQPTYVLVSQTRGDGKASDQFVVRTEYGAAGKPRAVVSLREGVTSIDDTLHTLELELQLGQSVLERQEVLIDIESEAFRNQFLQDRLERVNQELAPANVREVRDWVDALETTGEFSDLSALDESQVAEESLERLSGIAQRLGTSSLNVDSEKMTGLYAALEARTEDLVAAKEAAQTESEQSEVAEVGQDVGQVAFLIADELAEDLASGDTEVQAAAEQLREELAVAGEVYYTVFTGLGVNQEVSRETLEDSRERVLGFLEAGSYAFNDVLRIELGTHQAMVQATLGQGFSAPAALSIQVPITLDTYVVPGETPEGDYGFEPTLLVGPTAGSYNSVALFSVNLSGESGRMPGTGALRVSTSGTVPNNTSHKVSAYYQTWQNSKTQINEHSYNQSAYATVAPGFKPLGDFTVSASPISASITQAVQRALMLGDSNADGSVTVSDSYGKALGDVEAFYQAVRNWTGYAAQYGGIHPSTNDIELIYRNDANWDGQVNSGDIADFFLRLNTGQANYNLDNATSSSNSTSDGLDYSVWSQNYGRVATRFSQGDGNFDGFVNDADLTIWQNAAKTTHGLVPAPQLLLRVESNPGTSSSVAYHSSEQSNTTLQPAVDLAYADAEATITRFIGKGGTDGKLEIQYRVPHSNLTTAPVIKVYRVNTATQQETLIKQSLAADVSTSMTAAGVAHSWSFTPDEISDPTADYTIVARLFVENIEVSERPLAGGIFKDASGNWHMWGGVGNDGIGIDETDIWMFGDFTMTAMPGGILNTFFVRSFAGYDSLDAVTDRIASAWLSGGDQNDTYWVSGGMGGVIANDSILQIHDTSGLDKIDFANVVAGTFNDLNLQSSLPQDVVTSGSFEIKVSLLDTPIEVATGIVATKVKGPGYYDESNILQPIVVDTLADLPVGLGVPDNMGLRKALAVADAIAGENTITFASNLFNSGQQTITLQDIGGPNSSRDALVLASLVTLVGPGVGKLSISGSDQTRVMQVNSGVTATVKDLTIYDGKATGTTNYGAGIHNSGDLTLTRVDFESNESGTNGGAIYVSSTGKLRVGESEFRSNKATTGGAIYSDSTLTDGLVIEQSAFIDNSANASGAVHLGGSGNTGTAGIVNSTFSANKALAGEGGAIRNGSGAPPLTIKNSTIALNTSTSFGGGISRHSNSASQITLLNSIVAGNTVVNGTSSSINNIYRPMNSASSYNIIGVGGPGGLSNGNQGNQVGINIADVGLTDFGEYGGPTRTHGLKPTSWAIDAGLNVNVPAGIVVDQRGTGYTRFYDDPSELNVSGDLTTTVDIGAFEYFGQFHWREAEHIDQLTPPPTGPKFEVIGDLTASASRVIGVFSTGNLVSGSPLNIAHYDFNVAKAGSFRLWVRLVAPDSNANGLWWRLKNGPWQQWDNISQLQNLRWHDAGNSFDQVIDTPLSAGANWVEIASFEDGVQIDKLLLTDNVVVYAPVPTAVGGDDAGFLTGQIDLTATARDFHSSMWTPAPASETGSHPDFQSISTPSPTETPSLVAQDLLLGNPAFNQSLSQLTTADAFQQWFYDVASVNRAANVTARLVKDSSRPGIWQFVGTTGAAGQTNLVATTHEFFPVDQALYAANSSSPDYEEQSSDNDGQGGDLEADEIAEDHNYSFTLETHAEFTYYTSQNLYVELLKGNDDLWIFVDNRLLVDAGGVHVPGGMSKKYLNTLGLINGETYSFDLYYANRSVDDAHLVFETNIELSPTTVLLVEEDRLLTEHVQTFDVPSNPKSVSIRYSDLVFDTASNPENINDAFELALVDATGKSVVPTIGTGSGAFFSITEGQPTYLAPGVHFDGLNGVVTVDISFLNPTSSTTANDDLRLIARLVNDDSDTTTHVTLSTRLEGGPTPSSMSESNTPAFRQSNLIGDSIDVDALDDVSGLFDIEYTHTTHDEEHHTVRVGIRLQNTSSSIVRGPLIAVVKNIRPRVASNPADMAAIESDGIAGNGSRYYDLTGLAFTPIDLLLGPGDTVEGRELVFQVPSEKQFDYDLIILGHFNDAPYFSSVPFFADAASSLVKIPLGNTFTYDANGNDPEKDAIHFSFVTNPTGMEFVNPSAGSGGMASEDGLITWTPTANQVSDHLIHLRVTDAFGASTDQHFTVRVLDTAPNQSPYFIEPVPDTDAYVGKQYRFIPRAFDPDFDSPLYFKLGPLTDPRLGSNGDNFALSEASGEITWTPTFSQVDETFFVELQVFDRVDGDPERLMGTLPYAIVVHTTNQDPYFTSTPAEEFLVPPPPPPATGLVSPTSISTTLANGQSLTQNIYVERSVGSNSADIVIIIDSSDSMTSEIDWLQNIGLPSGETGFLESMDNALNELGITNNKFGLTIFHEAGEFPNDQNVVEKLQVGQGDFGTRQQLQNALALVENVDGIVDGYEAIISVVDNYSFRPDVARVFILITDTNRERDEYVGLPDDYAGILEEIESTGATLNVLVDAPFELPGNEPGLFYEQVGSWNIQSGEYIAGPDGGTNDAVSTFAAEPVVYASLVTSVEFTEEGLLENGYFTFDYHSPTDFKFAGFSADTNQLEIGRRTVSGWIVDSSIPFGSVIPSGETFTMSLFVDADGVSLRVSYGLYFPFLQHDYVGDDETDGRVGLATQNAVTKFTDFLYREGLDEDRIPEDFDGRRLIGMDFDGNSILADGQGGFEETTGGQFAGSDGINPPFLDSVKEAYVDLAWDVEGATWDLSVLRLATPNNKLTSSFAAAFSKIHAQQVLSQLVSLSASDPTFVNDGMFPDFTGFTTHDLGGENQVLHANYSVQFVGDGDAHSYSLTFKDGDDLPIGAIPVSISGAYEYLLAAVDPDHNTPLIFSWDVGGQPAGAAIVDGDNGDKIVRWNPPANWNLNANAVFKLTVSDNRGGVGRQEFSVNVDALVGNGANPTIKPVSPISTQVNRSITVPVEADDLDDTPLHYYLISGADPVPSGLTIGRLDGVITWTPGPQHATDLSGPHNLQVRVIDGTGGFALAPLQIEVLTPNFGNHAPQFDLTVPPPILGSDGIYRFTARATDDDHDTLEFDVAMGPGAVIDTMGNIGNFRWRPEEGQFGTFTFILRVQDGRQGVDLDEISIEVLPPNEPPVFVTEVLGAAQAGKTYQFPVKAIDPEDTTITYEPGTDFPTWLSINGTTGVITSTGAQSTISFDVVARDSQLKPTTKRYTLNVNSPAVTNRPPSIDSVPHSHIAVGQELVYRIDVSDPDNNVFTIWPPILSGLPGLNSPSYNVQNRVFQWLADPTRVKPGDIVFVDVFVQDSAGLSASKSFPVLITDNFVNQPPQITDKLLPSAVVGQQYDEIKFEAVDPDGDTVFWSLEESPDPAMVLDPSTGKLVWTPDEKHLGLQAIRVRAIDIYGAYSEAEFSILVRGVNPPTVTSNPPSFIPPYVSTNIDVTAGDKFHVDVFAADPDGGKLFFELTNSPKGMYIIRLSDTSARIVWTAPSNTSSTNFSITAVVFDQIGTPGTNSQNFIIHLLGDDVDPTIGLSGPTKAVIGSGVNFLLSPQDNIGISDVRLTARLGAGASFVIPVDDDFVATHVFSSLGIYTIEAIAIDTAGNPSVPATLQLEIVAQAALPTVEITTTFPTGPLTESTAVQFRVDNHNSLTNQNAVNYRLELVDANSGEVVNLLKSGSGEVLSNLIDPPTIVPTAIANGVYLLRLTAENEFKIPVTDEVTIQIETGRLKVGNFAISFVDLQVPVSGIPITISRSYDSLAANEQGDFGYGWKLDLSNTKVEINFGDSELSGGIRRPFVSAVLPDGNENPDGGTRVVITLPDGTTEGFTFFAKPIPIIGNEAQDYLPRFQPDQGVTSELIVSDIYLRRVGNSGTFLAGEEDYTPLKFGNSFTLKTRSGLIYLINAETGDLSSVTDRNKNFLKFTGNGIYSSAGRAVTFEYDLAGRIKAIIDPSGRRIEYGYDAKGNLVSVLNRELEETTFEYDDPTRPHFLTGILNNQGVRVLDPEFDPVTGRLIRLGDASNQSAEFDYPAVPTGLPNGSVIERIKDAKNVPTELVRDTRGNVIRRIQRVNNGVPSTPASESDDTFLITVFEYDANDNQTKQSRQFRFRADEHSNPSLTAAARYSYLPVGGPVWQSISEFDPNTGDLLWTQTLLENNTYATTTFTYDKDINPFGQPVYITDANGTTTENGYNPATGNLTSTTVLGKDGKIISQSTFSYDDGQLTEVKDALGRPVSSFAYNDFGDLTSTTDADQVTRHFVYDEFGNQTLSYSHWDNGIVGVDNVQKTIVSRTLYDDEGRVIETRQYTVNGHQSYGDAEDLNSLTPDWTTETHYDAAGRVSRSVDRYNNESFSTYDLRGNLVESRSSGKNENSVPIWIISRTLYDTNGRAYFTTDPYTVLQTDYNQNPNAGVSGLGTHTTYDDLGRVTRTARYSDVVVNLVIPNAATPDLKNSETEFEFDTIEPASESFTYYDDAGRVKFALDPAGLISEFVYDDAGRQKEVKQYLTGVLDDLNAPTAVIPEVPGGVVESATTKFEYDNVGRQWLVTDALDHSTRTVYDELGRVTQTIFHDGTLAETKYNKLGQREAQIGQYDPASLTGLTPVQAGAFFAAITTNYEYDLSGRLTAVVLPPVTYPGTTGPYVNTMVRPRYEYVYDQYGNQTVIRDNVIVRLSDGARITDHNGVAGDDFRETRFTYDEAGRQLTRTLPLGVATPANANDFVERSLYDDFGRQTRHVDFEGRTVDFIFDQLGRLDKKHYFNVGTTPPVTPGTGDDQGADNNVDEAVDYVFDALGRTTQIKQDFDGDLSTTPDQRVTDNVYDAEGRLQSTSSAEGAIFYDYFPNTGQLRSTSTGSLAAPTTKTEYQYNDRLGRMTEVKATWRNGVDIPDEVTQYRYDKVGNLNQVELPNNVISDYDYDALNRLVKIVQFRDNVNTALNQRDATEPLIATFDYFVRADGKRTQAVESLFDGTTTRTQTFTWNYDNAGRLVSETLVASHLDDYADTYKYDLVGNRLEYVRDSANNAEDRTVTYQYDANDRLLYETKNVVDPAGDRHTVYQYGASNTGTALTSKTAHVGLNNTGAVKEATTYGYNVQGRMASAIVDKTGSGGGVTTTSYTYADNGSRVTSTENNVLTKFLVDEQNHTGHTQVIEEKNASNIVQKSFTLGHDVLSQAGSSGTALYFLYDGHGSTRALLTASGAIATNGATPQVFTYDAYGNAVGFEPQQALTAMLYSGERFEIAIGMQYLRARYYDPATGRFNRMDDFGGNSSLHKYTYTSGDPILFGDPLGLFEGVVGLSAANGIAAQLSALDANVAQSVGASLGADLYVDPLDIIFSRDLGVLPDFVYDSIDRAIGFVQANSSGLVLGATFVALAGVFSQRQTTLFDKFARHNNEIAGVLSPGVTQLIHETLKHSGALRATAKQVHSLVRDKIGLQSSTIALAEVRLSNGTKVILGAASSRGLEPAQEAALKKLGVFVVDGSGHAERNIVNQLPTGAVVERWGISRSTRQTNAPCDDCWALINEFGGSVE